MIAVLESPEVLQAYGLPKNVDFISKWAVGPPDSLCGITAMLAQPTLFPRIAKQADTFGNYKDSGRYSISSSRARKLCSYHCCAESLEGLVSPAWQKMSQEVHKEEKKNRSRVF